MKKSLYEILGVEKTATANELRAAYDELLAKAHEGDTARRLALKEAWSVLGHVQRRAAYDASLHAADESLLPGMGRTPRRPAREPVGDEPRRSPLGFIAVGVVMVVAITFGLRGMRSAPPATATPAAASAPAPAPPASM